MIINFNQEKSRTYLSREHDIMVNNPHENIVQYLGRTRSDKTTWFIMELCTLDLDSLREQRTMSDLEVAAILWQILKALNHLHQKHVMHRYVYLFSICKLSITSTYRHTLFPQKIMGS